MNSGPATKGQEVATTTARENLEQPEQLMVTAWRKLRIAVIDDAMHPPILGDLAEHEKISALLKGNAEIIGELKSLGAWDGADPDAMLAAVASSHTPLMSRALLTEASPELGRVLDEHATFRRLQALLEAEVEEVLIVDPFKDLPDLTRHDIILLDYFLEGGKNEGALAEDIARKIAGQKGPPEQQIVLMSSRVGSVRPLRKEFRGRGQIPGAAFAFVGKPDLNAPWKVKAHLGMLTRARPYARNIADYRMVLTDAVQKAAVQLFEHLDDLDIGDYAFLQHHALMDEGHPLGDYFNWLASWHLASLAFENEAVRKVQRDLDRLGFVGEPFASTEPSTVIAGLLHSALISPNVGPLEGHPVAKVGTAAATMPVVRLGDVFFDANRTKAVVVMSADCDLAFSPEATREPDGQTPVLLVPGIPVVAKDTKVPDEKSGTMTTRGILRGSEVYQIDWSFKNYRAVTLGALSGWLKDNGFETTDRDRLRPLFALKLQQKFGSHILRIGEPVHPPITTKWGGDIFICFDGVELFHSFNAGDVMVSKSKSGSKLRVTTSMADHIQRACESLRETMTVKHGELSAAKDKKAGELEKKIEALSRKIANDDLWISALSGIDIDGAAKKDSPAFATMVGGEVIANGTPRIVLKLSPA